MNDDALPDAGAFADGDVGIDESARADRRLVSDITVGPDPRAVAHLHPGLDHGMGADENIFA